MSEEDDTIDQNASSCPLGEDGLLSVSMPREGMVTVHISNLGISVHPESWGRILYDVIHHLGEAMEESGNGDRVDYMTEILKSFDQERRECECLKDNDKTVKEDDFH